VIDAIREIVEAARDPASWPSGGAMEADDSAGLMDIPGGRKIYLECRASGTPSAGKSAGNRPFFRFSPYH
jgi:hypothetical protein